MLTQMRGRVAYLPTYAQMQAFTAARDAQTEDQLWVCEHPPVYTQGLAGKAEHVLLPGDIPVVSTNRGGQVTYHGPGQLVGYPIVNVPNSLGAGDHVRLREALETSPHLKHTLMLNGERCPVDDNADPAGYRKALVTGLKNEAPF